MGKLKVLIVDDHPKFLEALKYILLDSFPEQIDFVEFAANGEECLEKLEEKSFDIVFMDMDMPIMNGISATRAISEIYRDIKIIALSMHSDLKYVIKMIEAGAKNFLVKEDINKEKLEIVMTT